MVAFRGAFTSPRWRISAENPGGAPSTSTTPVRHAAAALGRGTREAQPRFAWSQPMRGIRVNPPPIRLSRQGPGPQRRGLRPL